MNFRYKNLQASKYATGKYKYNYQVLHVLICVDHEPDLWVTR